MAGNHVINCLLFLNTVKYQIMQIEKSTKTISTSGKRRHGKVDGILSKWKQVVIIESTGRKKTNGQPAYRSKTRHVRAD